MNHFVICQAGQAERQTDKQNRQRNEAKNEKGLLIKITTSVKPVNAICHDILKSHFVMYS